MLKSPVTGIVCYHSLSHLLPNFAFPYCPLYLKVHSCLELPHHTALSSCPGFLSKFFILLKLLASTFPLPGGLFITFCKDAPPLTPKSCFTASDACVNREH